MKLAKGVKFQNDSNTGYELKYRNKIYYKRCAYMIQQKVLYVASIAMPIVL